MDFLNLFKGNSLKKENELLRKELSDIRTKGFNIHKNRNMTQNWLGKIEKYDEEIFRNLEELIQDSRNLELNSAPYAKYLSMCEGHIVGPEGFSFGVSVEDYKNGVSTQNVRLNKGVEYSWKKWMKKKCADIEGKRSFIELNRLMVRTLKRDGEILCKKIRMNPTKENPFGFSLQILDPRMIDSLYGKQKPQNLENGNYVVMGVEFNKYHKPVAYYLRTGGERNIHSPYQASERERVPAEDIIHQFKFIAQIQSRGVPQACSVFNLMIDLEDFLKTAMLASKVGASSGIYLQQKENSKTGPEALADGLKIDSKGSEHLEMTLRPGAVQFVPDGLEMKAFEAKYPEGNFVGYVSYMLKLIASGMNVSYFTLANCYEQINFSSSKVGTDEDREHWKREQDWFIDCILNEVFEDWLQTSLLNNAISYEGGGVVEANHYESIIDNYEFKGRIWTPIDEDKYVSASEKKLKLGLTTISDLLASQGRTYDDILIKKKREEEVRKQYGFAEDPFAIKDGKEVIKEKTE